MKIIAEFEIPDNAEPLQATLDYYIRDKKKILCCAEVFGPQLKEAKKCLTTMTCSQEKN